MWPRTVSVCQVWQLFLDSVRPHFSCSFYQGTFLVRRNQNSREFVTRIFVSSFPWYHPSLLEADNNQVCGTKIVSVCCLCIWLRLNENFGAFWYLSRSCILYSAVFGTIILNSDDRRCVRLTFRWVADPSDFRHKRQASTTRSITWYAGVRRKPRFTKRAGNPIKCP